MKGMLIGAAYWAVLVLIHVALALPPALRERSWKRFFIALALSCAAIVLPIMVFSFSAFLVPDWKGACRWGWLDCFHVGKLALLPLVLWASASLYALEIYRTPNRTRPWLVLGIITGALVSTVCWGVGFLVHGGRGGIAAWLLVPLYVSAWYLVRSWQLLRAAGIRPWAVLATVLSSVPFWIAAVIWSRRTFAALPDNPPDCFVVTAAARGHTSIVGARSPTMHHGQRRDANQQLRTLWRLEERWASRSPRSHARFRRVYNAIGPAIASRITSPLRADLAYLAIKPVEIVARALLTTERREPPC